MNLRRVLHILGLVLFVLAGAQLVPLVWCLGGGESRATYAFVTGAAITGLLGALVRRRGRPEGELYRREGVLIVVGSWVLASLTGAIPYVLSGVFPNPADALFESTSGFTTTGATVLTDFAAAGRPILFWRNFTQWLGGIGIVVLFVALLSELGPGARFLFKLEVPGPKAEVMHARVRDTALALARIYLVLSAAQMVLLLLAGLGPFDALTHTFSTVATGGFSPHPESIGRFSPIVHVIVILFMLAGGVNFSLYFMMVRRRDLSALRDTELRFYFAFLMVAATTIALALYTTQAGAGPRVVLDAVFQTVSILTTTGFSTANFAEWPTVARTTLLALMIFGGCAGSTSGGLKLIRAIVGWRAAMREARLTFSPNSVIAIVVGREPVPEEAVRGVVSLLVLWIFFWSTGAVLLSVGDVGVETAVSASIATLSNIGPGIGSVGPLDNFAFFAGWQKLVMVAMMLLGRLEFFAVLALVQAQFWRR